MKQSLWATGAVLIVVLVGCSSASKLESVPVEDKSGTPVSKSAPDVAVAVAAANTNIVAKSNVAQVDLGKSMQEGAALAGPKTIYFDYDSFVIKDEFQSVVEAHARYIKADKNRKVAVEGHTDERGGREYNLALGQKRAEAVRRALGLLGVSDTQVEAVSFGKEKPSVAGSDEAALAKNRRAEIAYR